MPTTTVTEKISRPMNCFMYFRSEKVPEIKCKSPEMNDRDISKVIVKMWNDMPADEKEPYRVQASKAKAEHMER